MRRYFGTDGVRGVVGGDLTDELVERLGRAFALWSGGAPVLVGRDTRASGPALERRSREVSPPAASAVTLGGVLPTPAVALLAEATAPSCPPRTIRPSTTASSSSPAAPS